MTSAPNWASRWMTGFKHHGVFVLGAAMLVLYSYPAWLLSGIPGTDDLSNLNVPQRQLLGWFYQHGHWPLWNPFNFAGQPLLAAGQSGPLYFPNAVFAFLPIVAALKVSYVLHLLLLTAGMYGLAYSLTKHRVAAILSTVAFADSGFFVGHQIHTQMFDAMCWLPLVFWLFLRLQQHFTRRRLAVFALAFGGQIFAGHPQIIFYTVLFSLLYAFLMWLWKPTRKGIVQILWGLVGMFVGGLLASAQLLPTLQLITYSDRSQVSDAFLLLGSLPPSGLLQYLLPFATGGGYTGHPFSIDQYGDLYHAINFWEFLPFIGIVFLCLGIATALARFTQDRVVRTLTILGLFTLFLALGSDTFFAYVLTRTPGFDLFRVPARYVGLTDFSIALLAGIGYRELATRTSGGLLRKIFTLVPLAFIATLLVVWKFGPYKEINHLGFWIPVVELAVIFLLGLLQQTLPRRWPTATLAVLGTVGLLYQTYSLSPFVNWTQGSYANSNSVVQYLQQHLKGTYPFTRVASLGQTPVQMDRPASWKLPSVNGYDSLEPNWYVDRVNLTWWPTTFLQQPRALVDALGVRYIVSDTADNPALTSQPEGATQWMHWIPNVRNAFGLQIQLGRSYTITDAYSPLFSVTLRSGSHILTHEISGWPAPSYIFNLPRNWPKDRATQVVIQSQNWTGGFTIDSVQVLRSTGTTSYRVNELFGPRPWKRAAVIDGYTIWENQDTLRPAWIASPQSPLVAAAGSAKLVKWQNTSQVWHFTAKTAGLFVLSQTYDPSWTATLDGRPVSVQKTAGLLTGINVPKGSHTLKLTYKPRSFEAGLGITLLTLAFLILLASLPENRTLTGRKRKGSV